MRRRDLLQGALAALVAGRFARFGSAWASQPTGPRYVVQIFLRGGIDAVYTLDPKTRAEVASVVDVPYRPDGILEAGPLRFGPHFDGLQRFAGQMAVLRGVQVKTANHETGAMQFLRLKTAVGADLPSFLDIVGQQRTGQALSCVTLGDTSSLEYSREHFGGPTHDSQHTILDELEGLQPGDAALLSEVYKQHLAAVEAWPASAKRDQTVEHLRQVQTLFERLVDIKPFKAEDWPEQALDSRVGIDLQRTLWLLEHDLTRGVYQKIFSDWDSHFDNARKQTAATHAFVPAFARFLRELSTRRNEHGTLLDNTLVIVGSELGRFPQLNGNDGKDHFPETTLMFLGKGIRTAGEAGGAFGETGQMMEGLPLSLETGRPADGGALVNLDDVGTTLLHLCGVNPELVGYQGRRLRFLEAA